MSQQIDLEEAIAAQESQEFTNCADWMAYATDTLGLPKQEAYARYRKTWWMLHSGKTWNRRRKGVKGRRNRYYDASTSTEETAS